MKILAKNFGSYGTLSIDFNNLGLVLLYGDTGSGKSTIQDLVVWTLFGITAKNGSVDEVKNWDKPEHITSVEATYPTPTGDITIFRARGTATQNDLYWQELNSDQKYRGKDLSETQKLLEARVGINRDVFFTGSYFNEFSASGRFFIETAKNRRFLFEKIADLSFSQNLSMKLLAKRKSSKAIQKDLELRLACEERSYEDTDKTLYITKNRLSAWERDQANLVLELTDKYDNFEIYKQKQLTSFLSNLNTLKDNLPVDMDTNIKNLQSKYETHKTYLCPTCGGDVNSGEIQSILKNINVLEKKQKIRTQHLFEIKVLQEKLQFITNQVNTYKDQLLTEKHKKNPYEDQIFSLQKTITNLEIIISDVKKQKNELTKEINSLTYLNDLTSDLRSHQLENAIKEVEFETNRILETFFEGIFKVTLTPTGDDLEVTIHKDGRECYFTQLSKGQKQLLKLSFSIAIMKKTAAESGVNFPILMLDESLDGLDTSLKVKAYRLFEELSLTYPTIVLIDHSEALQSLFTKKFYVTLVNGISEVQEVE